MKKIAIWFIAVISKYNTLINYKWNTFVDNGVIKIEDSGSKPNYHAEMNSGKGISLNSSGLELDLTGKVTGATSMIYMIDGVATYTEALFYLFNTDNVYKDLYYFSDTLTSTEINKYSSNPNGFFRDVQESIIDNCVLNMPMDGTDEYVRDYANYSEGVNLETLPPESLATYRCSVDANGLMTPTAKEGHAKLSFNNTTILTGDSVLFTFTATAVGNNANILSSGYPNGFISIHEGINSHIFTANSDTNHFEIRPDTANGTDTITISDYSVKKLTGTHEISNYTTSARDTTSALNYGSQELNFLRDGLWRGDLSKYLQMNEEKPALKIQLTDTELWANNFFQIEMVVKRDMSIKLDTPLLYSRGTHSGVRLQLNSQYAAKQMSIRLYDNQSVNAQLNFDLDSNLHHIIFTVNATQMYSTVDGIDGTSKAHSFVPSGLNFADSTQPATVGELRLFRIHKEFQNTLDLYNQAVRKGILL